MRHMAVALRTVWHMSDIVETIYWPESISIHCPCLTSCGDDMFFSTKSPIGVSFPSTMISESGDTHRPAADDDLPDA